MSGDEKNLDVAEYDYVVENFRRMMSEITGYTSFLRTDFLMSSRGEMTVAVAYDDGKRKAWAVIDRVDENQHCLWSVWSRDGARIGTVRAPAGAIAYLAASEMSVEAFVKNIRDINVTLGHNTVPMKMFPNRRQWERWRERQKRTVA